MVIHLSSDLMLVGKVSGWAKSNDIAYRNASNMNKFEQMLAEEEVSVVLVDLQIALGSHLQIDQAVPGEQLQHVVEEADAGCHVGRASTAHRGAETRTHDRSRQAHSCSPPFAPVLRYAPARATGAAR